MNYVLVELEFLSSSFHLSRLQLPFGISRLMQEQRLELLNKVRQDWGGIDVHGISVCS